MNDEEYVKAVDWRHTVDKLREENAKLRGRVKELEAAIGEVLDGTLPYLATKRLEAALKSSPE